MVCAFVWAPRHSFKHRARNMSIALQSQSQCLQNHADTLIGQRSQIWSPANISLGTKIAARAGKFLQIWCWRRMLSYQSRQVIGQNVPALGHFAHGRSWSRSCYSYTHTPGARVRARSVQNFHDLALLVFRLSLGCKITASRHI